MKNKIINSGTVPETHFPLSGMNIDVNLRRINRQENKSDCIPAMDYALTVKIIQKGIKKPGIDSTAVHKEELMTSAVFRELRLTEKRFQAH